jgi:putative transposase
MLGFKEFYSASVTLRGIELVRMIRKGQMKNQNDTQNPAEIFYSAQWQHSCDISS